MDIAKNWPDGLVCYRGLSVRKDEKEINGITILRQLRSFTKYATKFQK